VLSHAEYRAIVEQAPIMIWRSNVHSKCDYFNQRWLAFTGRTLEDELGDGWAKGVHPDDADRCLKTYREAFERREPFEIEYRLRRYDGEYRWVRDNGSPIYDDSGRFTGYIGSCVDVTDRVEARATLARATLKDLGLT
jgi:PAS domain S-box-containing protein